MMWLTEWRIIDNFSDMAQTSIFWDLYPDEFEVLPIGLVRQPGWLSHKSCSLQAVGLTAYGLQNCGFHKEVVQKLKFPNNSINPY
jgi:hypothetical protein